MWPYYYTKRGGLRGRIITLRGEVCVDVSLHQEERFVWPCLYTKGRGLCGRIITLGGEVCVAISFTLRVEVCVAASIH